jgi:two-component system chemotaxis sensor kinase CheA
MSSGERDSLDAMALEFIAEIKDDLAGLEPSLLAMEQKGERTEDDLINHAFRTIHSIKGGAGFIDFKELAGLGHDMENVLMRLREKTLTITPDVVDALLMGFDKMKLMVEQIGKEGTWDYKKEKAALQNILNPDQKIFESLETVDQIPSGQEDAEKLPADAYQALKPLGPSPVFQGREFLVDKKRLDHALAAQKFIYAVYVRFGTDLKAKSKDEGAIIDDMKSIGDILFSDLEESRGKKERDGFFCVISTILDLPLLSQVLEIGKTQMTLVDRQFAGYETLMKGVSSRAVKDKPALKAPDTMAPPLFLADGPPVQGPAENLLSSASTGRSLRINVDLISRLMNRAGELVLARNQLRPFLMSHAKEDNLASGILQNLDMVTADIQEAVMQMRMQPVSDLMGKYKRVVRDMARRISKKVEFILEGADVEVDRTVLEKLANPVTHLIRNCIDHGIEFPDERLKRSKPETGTIRIKAFHQGGQVHIRVSDDGAGIDPQLILSKAFEKGLVPEDRLDKMTDKEKIDLIFLPGFTTSEEITDISGRGVGMDVVRTNIESLRGRIEIDTVKGEGTQVHLIIPLTLAIVPSLIVGTGESGFAIPQGNIKEILYLEKGTVQSRVENLAGSEVLRLRGRIFPIIRLRTLLEITTYIEQPLTGEKEEEKRNAIADRRQNDKSDKDSKKRAREKDRRKHPWDSTYVIVLKLGRNLFGLCVDAFYDIEEVVVEPLSEYISHLKCFAGTALLGNGDVNMVLDVQGIAALSSLKFDSIKTEEARRNEAKKVRARGEKRNLIVFTSGKKEYFALELKRVFRLEPLNPKDIHYAGRLKHMEHKGHAVLLFSMDEFLPAHECDLTAGEIFVIFPKQISSRVGILASGIIDTIETDKSIEKDDACPGPVLGKLFIDGMMVQVLDPDQFSTLIEQKLMEAKGDGVPRENTDR